MNNFNAFEIKLIINILNLFFIGAILGSFYTCLASRILYYFYGKGKHENLNKTVFAKNLTLTLAPTNEKKLNTIIYKIKNFIKKNIIDYAKWKIILFKSSFCFTCKQKIQAKDLIPIFSFLINKSVCRNCKQNINFWNFLGETYLAIIGPLSFYFTQSFLLSILIIIFFGHLYISLVTDYYYFILDPENTFFLFLWALIYNLVKHNFNLKEMQNELLTFTLIFLLFLFLFFLAKKRGLGFGDVLLVSVLALFLGLPWIFFVIQLGALLSILYIYFKKKNYRSPAPLGAFLIISILILYPLSLFFISNLDL